MKCSGPSNFCVWGSAAALSSCRLFLTAAQLLAKRTVETALMTIFEANLRHHAKFFFQAEEVQYSHIFHAKTHFCGQLKKNLRLFVCKCILYSTSSLTAALYF